MITATKWTQLQNKMASLGLLEADIVEKFIIGSGSGGQNLHKTASCVYLKHLPSGLEVKCQDTRMREDNRFHARRRLCEKFAEQILLQKTKKQQEDEKIRRQKKRRSRRGQQKILDEKHLTSKKKTLRKPPASDV